MSVRRKKIQKKLGKNHRKVALRFSTPTGSYRIPSRLRLNSGGDGKRSTIVSMVVGNTSIKTRSRGRDFFFWTNRRCSNPRQSRPDSHGVTTHDASLRPKPGRLRALFGVLLYLQVLDVHTLLLCMPNVYGVVLRTEWLPRTKGR